MEKENYKVKIKLLIMGKKIQNFYSVIMFVEKEKLKRFLKQLNIDIKLFWGQIWIYTLKLKLWGVSITFCRVSIYTFQILFNQISCETYDLSQLNS